MSAWIGWCKTGVSIKMCKRRDILFTYMLLRDVESINLSMKFTERFWIFLPECSNNFSFFHVLIFYGFNHLQLEVLATQGHFFKLMCLNQSIKLMRHACFVISEICSFDHVLSKDISTPSHKLWSYAIECSLSGRLGVYLCSPYTHMHITNIQYAWDTPVVTCLAIYLW